MPEQRSVGNSERERPTLAENLHVENTTNTHVKREHTDGKAAARSHEHCGLKARSGHMFCPSHAFFSGLTRLLHEVERFPRYFICVGQVQLHVAMPKTGVQSERWWIARAMPHTQKPTDVHLRAGGWLSEKTWKWKHVEPHAVWCRSGRPNS